MVRAALRAIYRVVSINTAKLFFHLYAVQLEPACQDEFECALVGLLTPWYRRAHVPCNAGHHLDYGFDHL